VSPTKPKRSPARRFSGSGTGTTDEELLSARNDAAEARSELDKERALRVKAVRLFLFSFGKFDSDVVFFLLRMNPPRSLDPTPTSFEGL